MEEDWEFLQSQPAEFLFQHKSQKQNNQKTKNKPLKMFYV